jgi:hypothetical protein
MTVPKNISSRNQREEYGHTIFNEWLTSDKKACDYCEAKKEYSRLLLPMAKSLAPSLSKTGQNQPQKKKRPKAIGSNGIKR